VADLMTLGLSGLLASKAALEVTSDNIVNANTDGYSRRDIALTENAAPGGVTMNAVQGRIGSGVTVGALRRAQDSFLAGTLRNAQARVAELDTLGATLARISDNLGGESTGLRSSAELLFDAFGQLALQPELDDNRQTALLSAKNFASAIRSTAHYLDGLQGGVDIKVGISLAAVNELAASLVGVNHALDGAQQGSANSASLLDNRDRILSGLSRELRITIRERTSGAVDVYLGDSASGRALVTAGRASALSVATVGGRLSFNFDGNINPQPTSQVVGGTLAGQHSAYQAVETAKNNLDYLARGFAAAVNRIQTEGVDASGRRGAPLFAFGEIAVTPGPANLGTAKITAQISSTAKLSGTLRVSIGDDGSPLLSGAGGTPRARGLAQIAALGLELTVEGNTLAGDSFELDLSATSAASLTVALSDGRDIATGYDYFAAPSRANRGTSVLSFAVAGSANRQPPAIDRAFSNTLTASQLLRPLRAGAVASIPAGISNITLRSFNESDVVGFAILPSQLAQLRTLSITLTNNRSTVVSLDDLPRNSLSELAASLTNSAAFSEYGLAARVSGTSLEIIGPGINTIRATDLVMNDGSHVQATATPGRVGEPLRIFTRDGVQVAGPALSETEAAALVTAGNGFSAGARYVAPAVGRVYRDIDMFYTDYAVPLISRVADDGITSTLALDWAGRGAPSAYFPGGNVDSGRTAALTLAVGVDFSLEVSPPSAAINAGDTGAAGRALMAALNAAGTRTQVVGEPLAAFTDGAQALPAMLLNSTSTVRFSHGERHYVLTAESSQSAGQLARVEFTVTALDGGPADVQAAMSADGRMVLRGPRSLDGARLCIDPDNAPETLAAWGLGSVTGRSLMVGTTLPAAPLDSAFTLQLGNSVVQLTTDADGVPTLSDISGATIAASLDARFIAVEGGVQLALSLPDSLTLSAACGASAFGFYAVPGLTMAVGDDGLTFASAGSTAVSASLNLTAPINSEVTFRGPLPEELLLVSTAAQGTGFGAQWSAIDDDMAPPLTSFDIDVASLDDSSDLLLTFRDRTSQSVMATKLLSADGGTLRVNGCVFNFDGRLVAGDSYSVERGELRPGDNRNAIRLADLASGPLFETGTESFLELAAREATRTANDAYININAKAAATTTFDTVEAQHAQQTGVNLDEEAAALMKYQQAYQAAAQVMTTARTLFEALLQIR
jgi:flagellar hook-associated protein FlgK